MQVEAVWPLWVVGGAFVLVGVIFAAAPEEGREFFARQVRVFHGERAARRYRTLPTAVFRAVALGMVAVGIVLGSFAAGL
ncbi:hypothetical protein Csp2054_04085 [Curtobacterium sp. 'Ferrero']|nr:hypothetical protein Csp2054_04085 [Curtobacterium sp. 'Ferrero']